MEPFKNDLEGRNWKMYFSCIKSPLKLGTYSLFQKVGGSSFGGHHSWKWSFFVVWAKISIFNNFFSRRRMKMTYIWKMLPIKWTFWKTTSWYPENDTYPIYYALKPYCQFSVSKQYHIWTLNFRWWAILWCFWA